MCIRDRKYNDQTLKGVWLVQMKTPEYEQEGTEIQNMFQSAPMRFDSLVFTFYAPNMGKMATLFRNLKFFQGKNFYNRKLIYSTYSNF